MKMKKIAVAAALSGVFVVSFAQAATTGTSGGTINFTGAVNADTCNVTVNGDGTGTTMVALPTVQASYLKTAGVTTGQTTFKMEVEGCKTTSTRAGGDTVKAYFSGGPSVDTNGHLSNTAATDAATNVVLELVDGTTKESIQVGTPSTTGFVSINSGKASLSYDVRYLSMGEAGAGNVESSVQYTLVYK